MDHPIKLAIVGATGAVGCELLKVLEKRQFPIANLRLFASQRSVGKEMIFKSEKIPIQVLSEQAFDDIDLAIFSAGRNVAREWAPIAIKKNVRVIDNSSAFRLDENVPLVIPEINPHDIHGEHLLISSPNCSATIMTLAIAPLHRHFKILRVVAATYQAASGAGLQAMKELKEETLSFLEGRSYNRSVMPHPYAFNLFPHNSPLEENGYVEEEMKMLHETRKILNDNQIWINATCVRVPVLRAHAEALNITFSQHVSVEEAYQVLKSAPGVVVLEEREKNRFPMPSDASGCDDVFCGRIRKDISFPNTLDLWVVGDQLLKGAALNTVQIAEIVIRKPVKQ